MAEIDPIYGEIAEKMKMGRSKTLPALLQKMVDVNQAKILRELPASSEDISKALAMDKADVDKQMQYFFERGLVTPGKKGWNLHSHRVLLKDHIGSANPKYDDDAVFDLAKQMSLEGTVDLEKRIQNGTAAPVVEVMRVIPKWRSIQDVEGVLPCEDMREILKNAAPIMLYGCACRRVYRERPCKETHTPQVCFGIGKLGDYAKARKLGGKELTYDEALAFFNELDEQPFVTTTGNTNQMPLVLCNCHEDCCGLFINRSYTKPLLNKSPLAKSRFVATDNPEACTACGACLEERCPVGATGMKFHEEYGDERSFTDYEECIGCGLCVVSCPTDARKMRLIRTPEHIPDAKDIFDI